MTTLARRLARGLAVSPAQAIPVATAVVAVISLVLFGWVTINGEVDPGSGVGYGFGIAAALALLVVMLYSIRRGLARVRALGRTRVYLEIHIWVGGLFLLLLLLHTSFGVPAGVFTTLLWLTSLWVVATGATGLLLQRWVPKVLVPAASFEVHLRRIPELVDELRGRAEAAVKEADPRLQTFYAREFAPDLASPRWAGTGLFSGRATAISESRATTTFRRTLPAEQATTLDALCDIHATKREMDVHYSLQRILRGWLYLHLPFGVLLLGLVLLHVFFTTYF